MGMEPYATLETQEVTLHRSVNSTYARTGLLGMVRDYDVDAKLLANRQRVNFAHRTEFQMGPSTTLSIDVPVQKPQVQAPRTVILLAKVEGTDQASIDALVEKMEKDTWVKR